MEVRRRKIRISFSDPDATDSDSGEDASSTSYSKTKIVIFHCSSTSSSSSAKKNPGGCGGSQQRQTIRSSSASFRERAVCSPPVMKRCRGVYERQPGRWAAEFRSHRLKARHWIGTFATEEEAKAAYDDFERQFVPSRRCGLPLPLPALELGCGRAAGGVHGASHHPRRQRHPRPPDIEKRQIVQALTATGITLPPLRPAPCVSNYTSASRPPPPLVPAPPMPPFENAEPHGDALPSVHSFWADEAADEDLVGLADLAHLPLPFRSDGSLDDFDPDDLSLFDGFL